MSFDISAANNFVGIPELAHQWGVTEQHIYNLVKRKLLPAYRFGRRLIVRREDAISFLERNQTAKAAA
jgi:excisionase family DNA binding protein